MNINNAHRKIYGWDLADIKLSGRWKSAKSVKRRSNRWARRLLDRFVRQEADDALAAAF